MIDLSEKEIKTITVNDLLNTLNVYDLSSGVYILRITDKLTKRQQSVKFSKL